MNKILFIAYQFPLLNVGGSARSSKIVKNSKQKGITPRVLMPKGINWYRESESQEADVRRSNLLSSLKKIECMFSQLLSKDSPLDNYYRYFFSGKPKIQVASTTLHAYGKFVLRRSEEFRKYFNWNFLNLIKHKLGLLLIKLTHSFINYGGRKNITLRTSKINISLILFGL